MGWKRVAGVVLALAFIFGCMPGALAKGERGGKMLELIQAARAAVVKYDTSPDLALLQQAGEKLEGVDLLAVEGHGERQEVRLQTLVTWMVILARVDAAKDPSFDPDDMPLLRVAPPKKAGAPGYMPGVDPNQIHDPEQRAEYLRAIQENRNKIERGRLQWSVRALDTEVSEGASRFIKRFYTRAPVDRQEVRRAMEKAGIGPQRQQAILSW
ncbi:MAG: hypothetical protein PHU46_01385 [Rhodocyclaceae bacterium]|nr:hypothetical protein [Rhodocyclaceae bacterium]